MEKLGNIEILGMSLSQLGSFVKQAGYPTFRAKQLFQWMHQKGESDPFKMKNLPNSFQQWIADSTTTLGVRLLKERIAQDHTRKFLFALDDKETIETVIIPDDERNTICVSSQVGCAMNCSFCATGSGGLMRNLTAAEIVSQVYYARSVIAHNSNSPLTNIVFMGMGEPFANYPNVMHAISVMNDDLGAGIGMRRFTISTCGIVPKIRQFADDNLQCNLAISLHAANDQKRSEIMPINKRYPLAELLGACRYYIQKTNRRVSFEYALIDGFNDGDADRTELARLLRGILCHVNIIPINPVVDSLSRPAENRVFEFCRALSNSGIEVTIRKERGTDIEAACGQLRQRNEV